MNNLTQIAGVVQKVLRDNTPAILTGIGVSGTVATAVLSAKATLKAAERLDEIDTTWRERMSNREKVEMVWDLYIPAGLTGAVTIGCILGSNHVSSKRAAAAYSLVAVAEKGFEEYRAKVVEQIGEKKEKAVRTEIANDRVNDHSNGNVIVASGGDVYCYEMLTDRTFKCDMQTLKKAQNDINARLISDRYVTLSEFYYLIGLPQTSQSSSIGWDSDRLLELEFDYVKGKNDVPCIAISYNYTKPL